MMDLHTPSASTACQFVHPKKRGLPSEAQPTPIITLWQVGRTVFVFSHGSWLTVPFSEASQTCSATSKAFAEPSRQVGGVGGHGSGQPLAGRPVSHSQPLVSLHVRSQHVCLAVCCLSTGAVLGHTVSPDSDGINRRVTPASALCAPSETKGKAVPV